MAGLADDGAEQTPMFAAVVAGGGEGVVGVGGWLGEIGGRTNPTHRSVAVI